MYNWKLVFAVRFSPEKPVNLLSIAEGVMHRIAMRKKEGDVIANRRSFENTKDSSVAVDFILSSFGTPVEPPFFEHNIFTHSKVPKLL